MIFDPDEPRSQARTDRQSLIRTDRGWAVLGQPTAKAEVWAKSAADELAELLSNPADAMLRASRMACDLVTMGGLRDG